MKLIVTDINGKIGPGDIVGAFINEAKIDNDDIGKINIMKNKAEVEIADQVAKKVVTKMNNNQIGGIEVKVFPRERGSLIDNKVKNYFNKYKKLVELERLEEMEQHELEIKRLSARQREKNGKAILKLKGRKAGRAFANRWLVKFLRQQPGEKLPETNISVGDLVIVSKSSPLDNNNPSGTVAEKTNYSLTVVFDNKPPEFLYEKNLRIDLYVNDINYQRMLAALEKVKKSDCLKEKLTGLAPLQWQKDNLTISDWINNDLNSSQKKAVVKAKQAADMFLIQGPPGTGKTVTAIEIINQGIKEGNSVLATADSNVAVDNLVERLVDYQIDVLRVGHPIRVIPEIRKNTLDYKILDHRDYQEAVVLREKAIDLKEKQEQFTHPGGRWRRGMSDDVIIEKAKKGKSARGVPPGKLKEMASWLKLQEQIDDYYNKINFLEDKAVSDLIAKADVICTTSSTAGSELLENREFDLVVIDEATQATEPATLISLVKARKAVLIGDHNQLPPTVLNQEVLEKGLGMSLFERLLQVHGREFCSLLKTQYRMHHKIMSFSSDHFYDGQLKSAPGVKNHTLKDLDIVCEEDSCFNSQALVPQYPIVFLDTCNMEAAERSPTGSNSYNNPVEVEIVMDILDRAISLGLSPNHIDVITPYKEQVELFNRLNKIDELEINTVDAFQGREKEMIISSLVRSNDSQNIGFLADLRRLNVTLTRARRKLILVGDSQTITSNMIYKDLITYIKQKGLYYSL